MRKNKSTKYLSSKCFSATYQNSKTHEKLPVWRKRITLSKNKYFVFFFSILRRKIEKKMHSKNPIWGNEKTSRETCTSKP